MQELNKLLKTTLIYSHKLAATMINNHQAMATV